MSTSVAGKPGSDPTLPDVKIVLGGFERQLCYDFNAIVQAETHTGINLVKAVVEDITARSLRGLLWAAAIRYNPELTLEEVGTWITPRNISTIHAALVATWFGSVEEPYDKDDAAKGEVLPQATTAA